MGPLSHIKELEANTKKEIELVRRDMKEIESSLKRDMKELESRLTIKLGGLFFLGISALAVLQHIIH